MSKERNPNNCSVKTPYFFSNHPSLDDNIDYNVPTSLRRSNIKTRNIDDERQNHRSVMRFWSMSLAVFAVVLGIAVAAFHREKYNYPVPRNSPNSIRSTAKEVGNVCLTKECYDIALKINTSIDSTVDPCDNFYQYTCGNLLKTWDIPEEQNSVNEFYRIGEQLKEQLKSLLKDDDDEDDIRPFKLAKALYKSCVNEKVIEAKGVLPLKNFIQARGGWPVLQGNTWIESKFDWMGTIAEWQRDGLTRSCFITIAIRPDQRNSSQHAIHVDEPGWELDWKNLDKGFDNNTVLKVYYEYMVDVAVVLGADRKRAEAELKDVIHFQIELNKLILSPEDSMDPVKRYHKMTLKELAARNPSVKWRDTLRRMYSPFQKIGDDEPIIVTVPEFIKNVIELISKTPKRVQANFAVWQIMVTVLATANQDIRNARNAYKKETQGIVKNLPRWKECVEKVAGSLGLSLGAIYVRKFLPAKTKSMIEEMIDEIVQDYVISFDKVSFLDEPTKAFARKKAKAIKKITGYPKEIQDNGELENHYRDLELADDEYFLNALNFTRFNFYRGLDKLRKPVDKNDWTDIGHYVPQVNAFAVSTLNAIMITAGILQGAFFHPERPRSMNFGSIGVVIGHEISHLFDVTGREYDENGDLKDWWTPLAKKAFDKQKNCFIYQYGNYTEDTLKLGLNGVLTIGENITDNGGVKRAYHAYVDSMLGEAPGKQLPGLDFTPNQLFWIAFGNSWCSNYRESYLKQAILTGVHTIPEYRIIGSLSNSKEFAEDFKCPSGSKMNPIKKCSIW